MSIRSTIGLRASNVLPHSLHLVTSLPTRSLRPFSITIARCKSPKIRTRFSGPQSGSPEETVTFTSSKQLAEKRTVSYPQPPIAQDSSISGETVISFAETRPFPHQDLSSTRPAALKTPEAPKPQDHNGAVPINVRFSYLYRLGRSYVSFYKTGLKNIWFNYKEYRKIKQRLGSFPLNDVVKYSGKDGHPTISRREYQLCLRTRHDIKKLIPFGLILLICGEFTPLVVLALGSAVVPSTCRIPRQVAKDDINAFKRLKKLDGYAPGVDNNGFPRSLALLEARVGYVWGLMPSQRPLPLVHSLLRSRVKRHAEELVCDAILIRREGGVGRLEPEEVIPFATQASLKRLERQIYGRFDTPSMRNILPGGLTKLFVSTFEEYIDETLNTLRHVEDHPDRHYLSGLKN
jgi:hypothetical protein